MRGLFPLVLVLSACGGTLAIDLIPKLNEIIKHVQENGIPNIPLDLFSDSFNLKGSVDKLAFNGLDTATILKADLSIAFLASIQNMLVRELVITGSYDINGNIKGTNIVGKGNFSVVLSNVILNVDLKLASRQYVEGRPKYAYISDLTLDLGLKDIKVEVGELAAGGGLGDLVNNYLSDVFYSVATTPEYRDELVVSAKNFVNEKLIGTTLADLLLLFTS